MDKYIKQEELIKTVCEEYQGCMNSFYAKPNDFVQIIENAPVFVIEERHGHWVRQNILASLFGLSKCSECGVLNERTYFCPFCGARMDEEQT